MDTSTTGTGYTDMQLSVGGQVYVGTPPQGVTVTSATEQWFIQNH